MTEAHSIILRATMPHRYSPGALACALAAYDAMEPKRKAAALAIYRGLLAEPMLPAKAGSKRGAPKKPVYRHNAMTVKRAAVARRKLEERRDHDHD